MIVAGGSELLPGTRRDEVTYSRKVIAATRYHEMSSGHGSAGPREESHPLDYQLPEDHA